MTVAKNVLNRIHVQRLLLAVALLGFSLISAAAKLPGWQTAGMTNNGSKSWSMSPGGGDLRVPIKNPGGGWQTAGNYGVQNGPTGATFRLGADGQVFRSMPDGTTIKYPARIEAPLSVADLAKAAAGFLGGPLGLACALACPLAIDWMASAGGRVNPDTKQIERKDPNSCDQVTCDQFMYFDKTVGWASRPSFACPIGHVFYSGDNTGYGGDLTFKVTGLEGSENPPRCGYDVWQGRSDMSGPVFTHSFTGARVRTIEGTPGGGWIPSSMDDIAPYMAQNRPDPNIVGELLNRGADLPLPKEATVTGPSSINGPEKTTSNPDGSRTVEKTTYNFQTSGNTVTNTTNVTTTTTYNTDNSVRSVSNTTTTPTDDTTPEKEDDCKANPQRLGCAELDEPTGEIPKTTKNITFEAEDVLGGGACPANVTTSFSTLGGQSATIVDWQTFCGHALPLRALVMGLAAIMAFFIIMPGGVRE